MILSLDQLVKIKEVIGGLEVKEKQLDKIVNKIKQIVANKEGYKNCPTCTCLIRSEAHRCHFCGSDQFDFKESR